MIDLPAYSPLLRRSRVPLRATAATLLFAIVFGALPSPAWAEQRTKGDTPSSFPKCTDALSTVDVPGAPHGLFVLLFPGARVNERSNKLLNVPTVCGANVFVQWKRIDRGPGANPQYDWSSIDDQIRPWAKAGKVVNLIVWATGYGARANNTPDYVFDRVPSVDCPAFGHTPIFWEPGFMQNYQAFMSALVNKYGGNSSIGYIRFGLGAGGEIYPACMYKMMDHGFSKPRWKKYLFDMLDYEKSLNSPKQLAVGLNAFGDPEDLSFTAEIAEHAAQNGIAIGNQGLTVQDQRDDSAGRPCMADWCKIFRRFHGKVPLVLQTGGPSHPDGSDPAGSMIDYLPFALSQHVQIFEIYVPDFMVAYDPSDPEYARHHLEYQKVFESAARVLGGN